jgi:hypothetical protein
MQLTDLMRRIRIGDTTLDDPPQQPKLTEALRWAPSARSKSRFEGQAHKRTVNKRAAREYEKQDIQPAPFAKTRMQLENEAKKAPHSLDGRFFKQTQSLPVSDTQARCPSSMECNTQATAPDAANEANVDCSHATWTSTDEWYKQQYMQSGMELDFLLLGQDGD